MNETLINIALWTACSILALLAMVRTLRKPSPQPVRIKVRIDDTDR